jgi:hypothetical protein
VSDINTAVVDSLKVLDLKRPIREGDIVSVSRRRKPAISMNADMAGSMPYLPFRSILVAA